MTKVLHIINGDLYAGAERVQDLLAEQLPQFDYDVEFVTLKTGLFAEHCTTHSAAIHSIPMGSLFDLRPAWKIAKLIRDGSFEIIHTHTRRSALIGMVSSYLSHVPMVHHVHSPSSEDTEDTLRNLRNSLVERLALHHAQRLIPVSASLEQYLLQRGYQASLITTVYNGVTVQALNQQTDAPNNEARTLTIACVALMRPRKGIDTLIQALAKIVQTRPDLSDVKVKLIGPFETTEYEQQIRSLCKSLDIEDNVEFTGFCNNVPEQLANCDIFCLPSHYGEGMPMVILEAMALGLPIVSTHVEGIPEQIEHKKNGLLVSPANAEQLANALTELCLDSNLRAQMGDLARTRQQELFSDISMAKNLAAIYDTFKH